MILDYQGRAPKIHTSAIVLESAWVIGDVELGADSSVWFESVVRGDVNQIRIGGRTNIQDLCLLHVTHGGRALTIGDEVTVGHKVTLHSCGIGSRCLIGMGAIIMDDAEIGDECLVGAGSLVVPGTKIPPRTLALGSPARPRRAVTEAELTEFRDSAERYIGYAADYRRLNVNR